MARELRDTDGFGFYGWMVNRLHLSGGELVAFALVHQFTQSDAGRYIGGSGYVSAWLGCSEKTARKHLHSLADKGLVVIEDVTINGVTYRNYRVDWRGVEKISPTPGKNFR